MPSASSSQTSKHLIVSLHDFHPGSRELIAEQVEVLVALGVPNTSILVVPNFHHEGETSQDFHSLEWLDARSKAGDDLVLHGFYHDRQDREGGNWFFTKFYTANEAEFLDLPEEEVKRRLEQGSLLWSERGWKLDGFIAPAWLMPLEQDSLLSQQGLNYTTRLKGIYLLKSGAEESFTATQSLCYSTRAWWRRVASLRWNPYLFSRLKADSQQNVIRLSLHPNDLTFPGIKKQVCELVENALEDGYQPLTYAEYAAL